MKKTSTQQHRFRLIKAYRTTLRIVLSFGWIQLVGRFLGTEWQTQKMNSAYLRNAWRHYWFFSPMALALGYGLLFATPITLILVPSLYMIGHDIRKLFQ